MTTVRNPTRTALPRAAMPGGPRPRPARRPGTYGSGGRARTYPEGTRIRVLVLSRSDGPLIRVAGEIDRHTAPVLVDALSQPWAAATPPGTVRVDLAGVEFCDSSALRALLDADRRAAAHGSTLLLLHPSRPVVRLLELTGVDAELAVAG